MLAPIHCGKRRLSTIPPLTAHLYVKPTMRNLWQFLVWWLLVWQLPVWWLLVWHLLVGGFYSLAMPIDGFEFGGGWFHVLLKADCAASVLPWRAQQQRA